jgi:predicted thioredoxin/glutaredoxin
LSVVQRRDCELCEELLAELAVLARSVALPPIDVLDVDADAQLLRRYGLHVPVLLLDGEVVCRHRLDVPELKRLLRL